MAGPPPLPPTLANIAPPLPPGWTEHLAPGGQPYYFNAITKESTYIRPLPIPPFAPGFPITPQAAFAAAKLSATEPEKKPKEKPKTKTPIPGTSWLRVVTTAGNVFYTNKDKKQSVWIVPVEIKDVVETLEKEEKAKDEEERRLLAEAEDKRRTEREEGVERVKREMKEGKQSKRKVAEEEEPLEELAVSGVPSKKARLDEDEDGDEDGDDDDDENDDDDSDDEMEDWQREAAAQLAAEAEEEERARKEEEERKRADEEEELRRKEKEKGMSSLSMPARVDLSIDEAKALFKTLLRDKQINPMLPWDTALPQFVSDPRYVLLPSVAARRDAFDEYCRERVREMRAEKVKAEKATADAAGSAQDEKMKAKQDFDQLLRSEVKSTRTSWTEWRRTWKKDRRFWGWGRDDRDRERRFREYLRELGEEKRKAAQKAEADFFALLREKASDKIKPGAVWKDVKKGLDRDPRYDAVGSSSLREELFDTYVKTVNLPQGDIGSANDSKSVKDERSHEDDEAMRKRKDKERKERAVREREEKVKLERGRVEAELLRSRSALNREESESEFLTLLTDAIREPLATWNSSQAQLATDPRFTESLLPDSIRRKLFERHVTNLQQKHTAQLHALFESHAPLLSTSKLSSVSSAALSSIQASFPAQKLHFDEEHDSDAHRLEKEFRRWHADRVQRAEREFQEMLNENSFVDFWGRVRKMQEEKQDSEGMKVEVGAEDLAGEEDAGEDGQRADLKALAKSIDVKEIERVLKNDKRYSIFDHVPEQREVWIREHIEKLAAPKLSFHIPGHGS